MSIAPSKRTVSSHAGPAGGRLVLTDAPDDWSELVGQIADLEELMNEAAGSGDHDAIVGIEELRQLVAERRLRLRSIDPR